MSHEDALATLILLISSYWNELFYDTFYYITFELDLMQFTKKMENISIFHVSVLKNSWRYSVTKGI